MPARRAHAHPKPRTRSTPWGPLLLAVAWVCLLAAAVLAVASLAGAQELGEEPPVLRERPGLENSATETGPLPVEIRPQPVALADVEWAGLLWGTAEGYLPADLLSADVEIHVTGFVARSRVTQRFSNPGDEWLEGVYLFPLPEDAAVDQLRLVVGERILEGQIREKEEARRTYERAREEGFTASLVEQHRPNVFTTKVANVGPGETVEVVIELQQAVRWDQGELSLRFPTVVNPRFFPDRGAPYVAPLPPALAAAGRPLPPGATGPNAAPGGEVGSGFAHASFAGRQLARSAERALEESVRQYAALAQGPAPVGTGPTPAGPPAGPANPIRFAVTLDAGFPLDYLDCPYHTVEVLPLGEDRFRVRLAGGPGSAEWSADRDFELVWAPRVGSEPRTALFSEEHDGDGYSLLMVLPPEEGASGWVPLDREMVFIIDVSGSMHGDSLAQAKAALTAALDGLGPRDSFNVIAFSDEAQPLFADSLEASPAAVGKARRWVAALEADGGTNMLPALAAALETPQGYATAGRREVKQVVFLTDGAVGNEAELFAFIARHLGEARLFTVGIGSAPNGHFMQRAAEEGRGTYTFIGDPREVALKVERLVRKLEGPVLTDLEVRWPGGTAEVWPERLPDLYAGEPLVVAARTPGGLGDGGPVEVSGRRGGAFWQREIDIAPAAAAMPEVRDSEGFAAGAGVRQLWAKRKISSLLATLATGADRDGVRSAVLHTALHHHLVSPYTSLVAVDVTPSRPTGAELQGRRVPGATPAGWTAPGTLPVGATGWQLHLAAGVALFLAALLLMGATSNAGRRWRLRIAAALPGGAGPSTGGSAGRSIASLAPPRVARPAAAGPAADPAREAW